MKSGPKSIARQQLARLADARFRWLRLQEGRRALKQLGISPGERPEALRRRAREDAVERLGHARHAVWLELYARLCGEYRDGWIPDSYYLEEVMPRVNGKAHHLARQSATSPYLLDTAHLPDLIYAVNGRFLDRRLATVPVNAVRDRLADAGPEVIFKADHSGFGSGVRTLSVRELTDERLIGLGNGVIQERLAGHPVYDVFGVGSLATLRLATVLRDDGRAEVRSCYLKVGRPGQSHVIAGDQLRIAVDWTTGAMADHGYLSDWRRVGRHPDTGGDFARQRIPGVADAVRLVEDQHARLPMPGFLCWDIAIDPDARPYVLEWEGGVVIFAEPTQGPCFADLGWDRLHLTGRPKG